MNKKPTEEVKKEVTMEAQRRKKLLVVAALLFVGAVGFGLYFGLFDKKKDGGSDDDDDAAEFVHVNLENRGDVYIVRNKTGFTGLVARNESGYLVVEDADGVYSYDDIGNLVDCHQSRVPRVQFRTFAETPFKEQAALLAAAAATKNDEADEASSIFPADLAANEVHRGGFEMPWFPLRRPTLDECLAVKFRMNETARAYNETLATFYANVTESRRLVVVDNVIYRGPNVSKTETTAIRFDTDRTTVLNAEVPVSSLVEAAQALVATAYEARRQMSGGTTDLGDWWQLSKAAYDFSFWWSDSSPPQCRNHVQNSILRDFIFYFLTVCVGVLEVVIILVETKNYYYFLGFFTFFFFIFWLSGFRIF